MDISAKQIKLSQCEQWYFTSTELKHQSGRYFSVQLIKSLGAEYVYINQPEVGTLAFVIVEYSGKRRWLLQVKPEPGNVGYVQYAPSVQATKSNYERVHGGAATPYLSLFTAGDNEMMVDVEGSEQGDRFLNKFNRNMKVVIPAKSLEDFDREGFELVTNEQLKALLRSDYVLNTDARSVIASGCWRLLVDNDAGIFLNTPGYAPELKKAFNKSYFRKCPRHLLSAISLLNEVSTKNVHLIDVMPWQASKVFQCLDNGIYSQTGERVVGYYDCTMPGREVERWQQPLFEKSTVSFYGTPLKVEDGLVLVGLRAEAEMGFFDRAEFTTWIKREYSSVDQIDDQLKQKNRYGELMLSVKQSDEGGRFWRNEGCYALFLIDETASEFLDEDISWVTLGELEELTLKKGMITNELRTMISLMLSMA